MKGFVIGFPKSGTTTIHRAVRSAGLKALHWKGQDGFAGEIIYRSHLAGEDPLGALGQYDFVSQADVCLPSRQINYWPNLDFAVLSRIRDHHPECGFVLNYRDPQRTAASIMRWHNMAQRIAAADIPGLPRGYGKTVDELALWIEHHMAACERFFAGDGRFLRIDIESADAPRQLADFLGIEIRWWGIANKNTGASAAAA